MCNGHSLEAKDEGMKILLKFKDGMVVQSVEGEANQETPEEFIRKFMDCKREDSTIQIRDEQMTRSYSELYAVEVLLD